MYLLQQVLFGWHKVEQARLSLLHKQTLVAYLVVHAQNDPSIFFLDLKVTFSFGTSTPMPAINNELDKLMISL